MDRAADEDDICAACEELIAGDAVQAPCNHIYCVPCIVRLFKAAVDHESSHPPSCCGRNGVPLDLVRAYLSDELIEKLEDRAVEFATEDRTYCSACLAFVRPSNITNGQAVCRNCATRTCSKCKMRLHDDACKEENEGLLLTLADQKGWKRCPRCRRMVEKGLGCNMIESAPLGFG